MFYSSTASQDRIVVGEPEAWIEDMPNLGGAYIFDNRGALLTTLRSPESQKWGQFGDAIAVDEDILVIGERDANVGGQDEAGRAHIFDTDGDFLMTLQSPEPKESAHFSDNVAASKDHIIVCESSAERVRDKGRVYVFNREGDLVETLQAPESTIDDEFGQYVYARGGMLAVSDASSVNGLDRAGRVYIFGLGTLAFDLSSLTISPSSLNEGDSVTVSCEVANTGTLPGSHTVTLRIDDEVVDEKTVSLDAGESTTVTFQVLASESGSYSVDVDGLTGSYEVKQGGIPGFSVESLIAGLAVAICVLWFSQRSS
jgi:hypothetical protein